jgi:hypothetical protein
VAGVLNWLFRRRRTRAVAELPRTVESGGPTSVQLAKALVSRADPAAEAAFAGARGQPDEVAPEGSSEQQRDAGGQAAGALEDDAEISPARLDAALQRLRDAIPASSEESPPGTPG